MKEQAYKAILDSIADGVFTVDDQWRITSWNAAAEQITGYTREEALGRHCYEVFRTNVCQTDCVLRKTLTSGKALVNLALNILDRDGNEKPISVSTAALTDEEGKIIGGAETFRDLSTIEALRRQLLREYSFADIISKSHRIQAIFEILPDIAESDSTVLITGPSGTGKELFARALHRLSPRADEPFITVNCAALPDTLLESELFGYVRGAFTDARRDKPGRFTLAQGGTLFLDEIGEISPAVQVKLLRVLQEKTFEPLGSNTTVHADVRILAATNKRLAELVEQGRFRDDLFYRLNVIQIDLPPLAERREDIPLLIEHFIGRFNAEKGKEIGDLTPDALEALLAYDWPGNIRELENAIEHAFILCKGATIDLAHLPRQIVGERRASGRPARRFSSLAEAEAAAIRQALAVHGGNRVKTAAALGMHKTTLLRKMKKLGVTYP
ncbi:MAG TPA: sigma 54-interacting transcriptional regulator [bacterium]|nr:sigma 54-interacting transcriptional regulator [bacterium]